MADFFTGNRRIARLIRMIHSQSGIEARYSCTPVYRQSPQAILQDAVTQKQGIAIFEQTHRHPLALLLMLVLPFIAWPATPFIRAFRWRRLLFTYLLPIIPAVLCFDGLV